MPENFDFGTKIVQIWLKGPAKGCTLQEVSLRKIGERPFLVGHLCEKLDGSTDPRMDCQFWLALDEVEMICVYPDLGTAQQAYAIRSKSQDFGPKPTVGVSRQ